MSVSNEATKVSCESEEATGRCMIVGIRGVTNSLNIFRVCLDTFSGEDMSRKLHRIGTKGAFLHAKLQLKLLR